MSTLVTLGLANAVCAALLALIALLVGRWCRRPAVLHSLWLLVLLKLVTPPFWPVTVANLPEESAVPVEAPVPTVKFAIDREPPPAPMVRVARVKDEETQTPNIGERDWDRASGSLVPVPNPDPVPDSFLPPLPAVESPAPAQQPHGLASCVSLLGIVWLVGVVVWLVWDGVRIGRFQRLLRHARRAGADIQEQTRVLAARMGLRHGPEIWLLPGALPPLVWAALGRVRVFFPAKLLDRLDETQRVSLLAHELAHVRRRDHWVRWLELIASALYWWYPLVWLARRRLHVHEEECCDAWAAAEVPARTYATAILNTLDFLAEDRAPLPVLASGLAGVELLKRRLNLIMEGSAPKRLSRSGKCVLVLTGLLLLALRPNLAQTETKPAEVKETKEQTDTAAPGAPSQVERGEDAESFLPNPAPLQGRVLGVGSVAFSPDGKRLAIGAGLGQQEGELRLWDADKGRMVATLKMERSVRSVAFSPDDKHLATAEFDGTIKLRDPASGAIRATLRGHTVGVSFVAFSADSKMLAAGGQDNLVTVWDVATRKQRLRLQGHTNKVMCVAFSPDGRRLLSCDYDGSVRYWDVATGAQRKLFHQPGFARAVKFSLDGRYAIAAGGGRSEDGKYVPGGNDFPIRVWSLTDEQPARATKKDERGTSVSR